MLFLVVLASCLFAQGPAVEISPVFSRFGIRAETRGDVATVRNEGPHVMRRVTWIWTGVTADGKRIPMIGGQTATSDVVVMEPMRTNFGRFIKVESTLDSVVLDGGTVVGPDRYGVIEGRLAQHAAVAEVAAKLNDAAVFDGELETWFRETGAIQPDVKPDGMPDHSKHIGGVARQVRGMVAREGRAKVAALFAEVTKQNAAAVPWVSVKE